MRGRTERGVPADRQSVGSTRAGEQRRSNRETGGAAREIRPAAFDVASVQREIEHVVRRARAGDSRLVTLGPLLFFSTSTGDAWMLDPSDGSAACLARDGIQEPVQIEERDSALAIEWPSSYRIDGAAMVFVERSTGRVETVLGYPARQVALAARRIAR